MPDKSIIDELTVAVSRIYEHGLYYHIECGCIQSTGLGEVAQENFNILKKELELLGGSGFAAVYLPFLTLLNGFTINGVTLFGLLNDENSIKDLRGARASLEAVPALYPTEFDHWVWVGETSLDVLIYNKQSGFFEQRDRIALDTCYEEPTTLQGLLIRLADLLDSYRLSKDNPI